MMAQPSYAPLSSPVSVIGTQFMTQDQFDIIVETNSSGNLVITDINHKIMLKVKPCDTSFHYQRVLLDAFDKPIVLIREKDSSKNAKLGKDNFMVTIYPNVDYAFVVTLISITGSMKRSKTEGQVAGEVIEGVGDIMAIGTLFS
ncbi:hypothetical protein L1887_13736 [Cichorium endivia]|nr:hypothetical protein L1887_13736 [Cichorium endivia]